MQPSENDDKGVAILFIRYLYLFGTSGGIEEKTIYLLLYNNKILMNKRLLHN